MKLICKKCSRKCNKSYKLFIRNHLSINKYATHCWGQFCITNEGHFVFKTCTKCGLRIHFCDLCGDFFGAENISCDEVIMKKIIE